MDGEPQDETAHAVSDLPESRWPRRQVWNEAGSTSSVSTEHLAMMQVSSCTARYGSHQPHGSRHPNCEECNWGDELWVLFCEMRSHVVAWAGLEFKEPLLPQFPMYWEYRCAPS